MYDILAAEAKSNKCVSCELNPTPEEFLSEPQKANERDDVPHLQVRPDPEGCPRLVQMSESELFIPQNCKFPDLYAQRAQLRLR